MRPLQQSERHDDAEDAGAKAEARRGFSQLATGLDVVWRHVRGDLASSDACQNQSDDEGDLREPEEALEVELGVVWVALVVLADNATVARVNRFVEAR
jgi:hypothetical protein